MSETEGSSEFFALQSAVAGRYSLEKEIGRGGMGIVYLARDVALERAVAIKLLAPFLAVDPEARQQFVQEARTAASLSHPNVVPIHLVEEHDDVVFFIMAFVEGETLRDRVQRAGPLEPGQAVRLLKEVAWALSLAHAKGIVHRDIKPENILIDRVTGRAMVTDFGIALATRKDVTGKGEIIGTVQYMSPEQAMGEEVDARSDLYSLGITAFYALTGSLPFDAPTVPALLAQRVTETAPALRSRRSDIPEQLATLVDRLLEQDPDARFQSGKEITETIDDAKLSGHDVPYSIRLFRTSAMALGTESASYALAIFVMSGGGSTNAETALTIDLLRTALHLVLGITWTWRLSRLAQQARQILAEGFQFDDVRKAFLADAREATGTRPNSDSPGTLRAILSRPVFRFRPVTPELTVAGGVALVAATVLDSFVLGFGIGSGGVEPPARPDPMIVRSLVVVGLGLVVASLVPFKRRATEGSLRFWSKIWSGPIGRWLFQFSGFRLRRPEKQIRPAAEPTETLIAGAAEDVFARLPAHQREQLVDVPNLVRDLQRHVKALRVRQDALTRSPAKPSAAERSVSEQLSSAVAALDTLRIDLLRLNAGIASVEDLTADLQMAREIGEDIDRMLEARQDVADVLDESPREVG